MLQYGRQFYIHNLNILPIKESELFACKEFEPISLIELIELLYESSKL